MLQMGTLNGEEANGMLLQVPNLLYLQRELWDSSSHLLELELQVTALGSAPGAGNRNG